MALAVMIGMWMGSAQAEYGDVVIECLAAGETRTLREEDPPDGRDPER